MKYLVWSLVGILTGAWWFQVALGDVVIMGLFLLMGWNSGRWDQEREQTGGADGRSFHCGERRSGW